MESQLTDSHRLTYTATSRHLVIKWSDPHDDFSIYLAATTITSDRAENLDPCLTLVTFNSDDLFLRATPAATWNLGL
jgi:hypothetical protein